MAYSLELRIKIVLLMSKIESPIGVRRCLQQENISTIQAIYDKIYRNWLGERPLAVAAQIVHFLVFFRNQKKRTFLY